MLLQYSYRKVYTCTVAEIRDKTVVYTIIVNTQCSTVSKHTLGVWIKHIHPEYAWTLLNTVYLQ